MSDRFLNAEVEVTWIAKRRFQWRILDGGRLVCKGEQPSVVLARAAGQAALAAARSDT